MEALAREDDLPEHVSAWRALLVLTGIAVPAFGLVRLLIDIQGDPDWLRRAMISALAFGLAWGSYRDGLVRRYLRESSIFVFVVLQSWFSISAGRENFTEGHVLGLMLICGMAVTLLRTWLEVLTLAGFALASIVWGYQISDKPIVPLTMSIAVIVTAIAGMSTVTLSRVRIERELSRARRSLEVRVAERTEALAAEVVERRAAEEAALQASRAKSRFLANMSHELRTPLNAIMGYTELVQDELADLDRPDLAEDLDRVREGATRLLQMIDDVLDLSRVESGHLAVRVEEVELSKVVSDIFRLLEPARARAGVALLQRLEPQIVLQTDPIRLAQILTNLLSNALKFTEHGSVTVRASNCGRDVLIEVIDTGIGIPAEAIGRLFQPFVQIDDAPTRRRGGTGLGLLLARDLAERLGGSLTASSERDRGSTFTLRLPLSGPAPR